MFTSINWQLPYIVTLLLPRLEKDTVSTSTCLHPCLHPFPNENRSAPWCDGRGELIKRVYLNGPIFLRKSDSLEFPIHSNEHVIHSSESVHPKYQNHPTESVHAKRFSLVCSVWIHSSEFHSMRFM